MSDNTAGATKEDIQMILEAMGVMKIELKEELMLEMDKRFEESNRYTAILIEDLNKRVLGMNDDRFSLQDDKIKNHEQRITTLESRRAYV